MSHESCTPRETRLAGCPCLARRSTFIAQRGSVPLGRPPHLGRAERSDRLRMVRVALDDLQLLAALAGRVVAVAKQGLDQQRLPLADGPAEGEVTEAAALARSDGRARRAGGAAEAPGRRRIGVLDHPGRQSACGVLVHELRRKSLAARDPGAARAAPLRLPRGAQLLGAPPEVLRRGRAGPGSRALAPRACGR